MPAPPSRAYANYVLALLTASFVINYLDRYLLSMLAALSVADLLRVLKTNSSRWVHEQFPVHKRFAWQAGYGAFTVSGSRLEQVRDYIAAQQAHHRRVSFQQEFLSLLRKHGLEFDAKEAWG